MSKRTPLGLLAAVFLASSALAQGPAQAPGQQPSAEYMQQAMMQMQMMAAMFDVRPARQGFEETVAAILASAGKRGWKVEPVQDVQAMMKAAGAKDAPRMKLIPACPAGANDRLAKASQGKAPPLPCRVTVFEGKDGKIRVMRFNTGLVAKGMQGEPAKVMAEVAAEEEAMLQGIVE